MRLRLSRSGDDSWGEFIYTDHARLRAAQRNLSEADLRYVVQHGHARQATGVEFVVLRRRDIPAGDRRDSAIARLEGAVVLINDDQALKTMYRNRGANRVIRRKHKWRLPDHAAGVVTRRSRLRSSSATGGPRPLTA